MSRKPYSYYDPLSDSYTHYDEKGKKVGTSRGQAFGTGYTHYDAKGHKTGESRRSIVGDSYTNYDAKGHKTGESYSNGVGYSHYDTKGHKTGESNWAPGGYDHNNRTSGCYIATCVYGSYDCPEVWTLRRFRDEKLLPTVPGRWFVKCYYKLSPKLVARYGRKAWFVKPWRRLLDWAVSRLK